MKRLAKACKNDILKDGEKHAKTIENMIGNEIKAQGIHRYYTGFHQKSQCEVLACASHCDFGDASHLKSENLQPKRHRTEFSV